MTVSTSKALIHFNPSPDDGLGPETLEREFVTLGSHPLRQGAVQQQSCQSPGKRVHIARRNPETSAVLLNDFGNPAGMEQLGDAPVPQEAHPYGARGRDPRGSRHHRLSEPFV